MRPGLADWLMDRADQSKDFFSRSKQHCVIKHNNDEESRPLWIANSKHVGYSMCSVDLYPSSRPH